MPKKLAAGAALKRSLLPALDWRPVAQGEAVPPARPPTLYPFDMMEVGDVVDINNRNERTVRQAVYNYRKASGSTAKFAVRKRSKTSCRVWRTA